MKKTFFALMIFISALKLSAQDDNILEGTDTYEYSPNGEESIFKYNSFKLTLNLSEEWNGYIIKVFNKNNKIIHTEKDLFFLGMLNSRYLIFDEGTSQSRYLKIYDLLSNTYILQESYYLNLQLINNKLQYHILVDIIDESKKPTCPKEIKEYGEMYGGLGYLEKYIFDFKTRRTIKTGKYECFAFE